MHNVDPKRSSLIMRATVVAIERNESFHVHQMNEDGVEGTGGAQESKPITQLQGKKGNTTHDADKRW